MRGLGLPGADSEWTMNPIQSVPQRERAVEEQRKFAYRHLLYQATLEIRPLAWLSTNQWGSWNPLFWRREARRIQCAGAIADWLHNLALYSALNFQGFKEDWFWRDFERVNKQFPEFGLERYRAKFDQYLATPEEPSPVRWQLELGGIVVARIAETGFEFPWTHGVLFGSAEFDQFRTYLFDRHMGRK